MMKAFLATDNKLTACLMLYKKHAYSFTYIVEDFYHYCKASFDIILKVSTKYMHDSQLNSYSKAI